MLSGGVPQTENRHYFQKFSKTFSSIKHYLIKCPSIHVVEKQALRLLLCGRYTHTVATYKMPAEEEADAFCGLEAKAQG